MQLVPWVPNTTRHLAPRAPSPQAPSPAPSHLGPRFRVFKPLGIVALSPLALGPLLFLLDYSYYHYHSWITIIVIIWLSLLSYYYHNYDYYEIIFIIIGLLSLVLPLTLGSARLRWGSSFWPKILARLVQLFKKLVLKQLAKQAYSSRQTYM